MSTPTAIGFDMGATSTKTGVVRNGKIITRGNVIETRQDGDTAALINAFIAEIRRLRELHPDVEAVGFGVPGIINPVQGVVVNLTNVYGWRDIALRSIIMRETGLVGNLENDAKAMAYAEWKHGAGQSVPNVVCVTLGTAVGVLSSTIPYSLEIEALRRIAPAVFGVLMSLEPAMAALAGLLILGQSLDLRGVAGIGLVVLASVGASRRSREPAPILA